MSETGQTLAGQIYAKSGADAKSIVLTAEKVAQRDIEQARRRTRTRTNAANAELAAQIASEKALAEATIAAEVTRSQLHARHTLVERLLGDTLRNLAGSARDEAYLAVLTRLVRESVGQLGGKEAAVRCSARDREFLAAEGRFDRIAADVRNAGGAALSLSEKTVETAGGVVVSTPDGRVSYYNTFEEIVYRSQTKLRAIISKELFE